MSNPDLQAQINALRGIKTTSTPGGTKNVVPGGSAVNFTPPPTSSPVPTSMPASPATPTQPAGVNNDMQSRINALRGIGGPAAATPPKPQIILATQKDFEENRPTPQLDAFLEDYMAKKKAGTL